MSDKFKNSEELPESPIPTRIIANGEYCPIPQTKEQALVEKHIEQKSDAYASQLGLPRRDFLKSSLSILVGLQALNEVFGHFFNVQANEVVNPDIQKLMKKKYENQFILDIQTHMIKDDFHEPLLLKCQEWTKHNCPALSGKDVPTQMEAFKFQNYMKEVFLDSDTDMAFLSGAPFPKGESLSNLQIRDATISVNKVAGTRLMAGYYVINPYEANFLQEIDKFLSNSPKPIGWKMFPIGEPFSTNQKAWKLDDEKLIYPFYEKARKLGIKNITIHKGLLPDFFEKKHPEHWDSANVNDLEKAAKDFPDLNFIIFHSALRSFNAKTQKNLMSEFYKTHRIDWSTDMVKIKNKINAKNIYAELGTSFASCAIVNPEFCAAFLGQLVNEFGEDQVLWGTDSVFYGSPQWQIDAFRRFEIPAEMAKKMNWKITLGEKDEAIKSKILGLNSAKLFNLPANEIAKKKMFKSEWIKEMKVKLADRSNAYYGYHI